MDIYVSACAPASPTLRYAKILRRHIIAQPDAVLRSVKCHPVLFHGPRIDPEYNDWTAVAAAHCNRSLVVR